jgi:hypothetical protein
MIYLVDLEFFAVFKQLILTEALAFELLDEGLDA